MTEAAKTACRARPFGLKLNGGLRGRAAFDGCSKDFANKVVVLSLRDPHPALVSGRHSGRDRYEDISIDLRCIPGRPGGRLASFLIDLVDEHLGLAPDLVAQNLCADPLLGLHEPVPALFLDCLWHMTWKLVGLGARHRFVFEDRKSTRLN